jgi:large subunit ribosomal protein L10
MATSKTKKQQIISELQENVLPQKSILFLSVKDAEESLNSDKNTNLRKKIREQGVALKMVKLNLVRNLFQKSTSAFDDLKGQIYLAYKVNKEESDEVSVAKPVVEIVDKEYKKSLNIFGSIVNGEFYDTQKTIQLSKTPSFTDSMSMMAGAISTIISKNASLINQIPSGLARAVQAVSEKKA